MTYTPQSSYDRSIRSLVLSYVSVIALIAIPSLANAQESVPSWTNTSGKTIRAEFVRLVGETLVIRIDGKEFNVTLDKLSAESRKQAKELGSTKKKVSPTSPISDQKGLKGQESLRQRDPPNGGRGAGTVPIWNPHQSSGGNGRLAIRVLVLNYNPVVPFEDHKRLTDVFKFNQPEKLAEGYIEALEFASGGYLNFQIVEWRNLNEIYAQQNGLRYTVKEYVQNRRDGEGWHKEGAMADYPRLLHEQNVVPLVDDGLIDEVWVFSDHYFGLWEASMAGPGAFFINGGVYPQVPSRRPFAFYGFNYGRGVAEMIHNTSHRTEATLNRVYGKWNLKSPANNWEMFSANHDQSSGLAGVGTCHWPANAKKDYDYGNERKVGSWADAFLSYPNLEFKRKPVSRATWSRGPDYHLDYMKWYFAHIPRVAGVNEDGKQNNWYKYIFDFQSYDQNGQALPDCATLHARDVADLDSKSHSLTVAYQSADHIDVSTIDNNDIRVVGSSGAPLNVELTNVNAVDGSAGQSYIAAKYQIRAPNESWKESPSGTYSVWLNLEQVRTLAKTPLKAKRLGDFRVSGNDATSKTITDPSLALHASFEGNTDHIKGKSLDTEAVAFETGVIGQGIVINQGSKLSYPVADVINTDSGTIEYWVKPKWDGDTKGSQVFFQAGKRFNNCLMMQIDGARNVRFMTWGDDPKTSEIETNVERGLGFSGKDWKAGEWHHLAATWHDSGRSIAFYLDGRLVKSSDQGIVLGSPSTKEITVGMSIDGKGAADAVFDELRIWKSARSGEAIKATAYALPKTLDLSIEDWPASLQLGERAFVRVSGKSVSGFPLDLSRQVKWIVSDPKVADINERGSLRAKKVGTVTVTAQLGVATTTAKLNVKDPGLPVAKLESTERINKSAASPVNIKIAYSGETEIIKQSLGFGDLRVVGPGGYGRFAKILSTEPSESGFKVTYQVAPTDKTWPQGKYSIEMKAFQVTDKAGNHVPEQLLGEFEILSNPNPGTRKSE